MPIIKDSAPVKLPNQEDVIVKYLDLTKFLSLLHRKALFFCRLDKLEDIYEGKTSKPNFEWRKKSMEHLRNIGFYKVPVTDDDILRKVKEQYELEKKLKALTCINCWNKKDTESAALWKIYSDFGKGIIIKSTIKKLEKSLISSKEKIRISKVKYINYDNDLMPDGNTMYPIIHKQDAYSYEDEIRLIHEVEQHVGWTYDWSQEEVEAGKYIDVNLDELITEIIVGPFSDKWQLDLIKDIANKYGINCPIKKSTLNG